jgi:anti-sigma B factor antagonist
VTWAARDVTDPIGTASGGGFTGFGVAVTSVGREAVLGIRGGVDLVSAVELGAVVNAAIDEGHDSVVLDLAAVDFFGAAGLGVIAALARRLQPLGGGVTVRGPSAMVRRLLDISSLADVVRVELPLST